MKSLKAIAVCTLLGYGLAANDKTAPTTSVTDAATAAISHAAQCP